MTKGITSAFMKEARAMIHSASFKPQWTVTMTRAQYERSKEMIDDYKKSDKHLRIYIIG